MKWLALTLAVASVSSLAAQTASNSKPPAQAERGRAIFLEGVKIRCGTCHALRGQGTAVGPDLTRLARLSPRAISVAIRSTRTQYVQNVKLKNDQEFPGMQVSQDDKVLQVYDLSVSPPELKKLNRADIASTTDNATWKHPPSDAGYTAQQLADVIGYIRWASYGDRRPVDPDDVE